MDHILETLQGHHNAYVLVYHSRSNRERAEEVVSAIRELGCGPVIQCGSDRWNGGIDRNPEVGGLTLLVHDGSRRELAWAYEDAARTDAGLIRTALFMDPVNNLERPSAGDIEIAGPQIVEDAADGPQVAPAAPADPPEEATSEWPEGYRAEPGNGSWLAVIGPDGSEIGKRQGEAAALVLAQEHAAGE